MHVRFPGNLGNVEYSPTVLQVQDTVLGMGIPLGFTSILVVRIPLF